MSCQEKSLRMGRVGVGGVDEIVDVMCLVGIDRVAVWCVVLQ